MFEKNWKALRKEGVDELGINCIKQFNATKLDWNKIKTLVNQSTVYLSDNDPCIPLSVQENYQLVAL
jgi:ABC-type transport system substrate-binding protein